MRKVFGPVAVSVIVGAIALVFVFYGVMPGDGAGGVGVAATVNGDSISMKEFSREYQQRMDFYQGMMKGKVDAKMLKSLGIERQVLEDLIRRKLMLQEAERLELSISDAELRAKIIEMPYFKKDGVFSASHYDAVLKANGHSPAAFEEMVREDLMRNHLLEFLNGRIRVSETEIEQEFQLSEDRRQVDYVVVDRDYGKKLIVVSNKDARDFLKTEAGLTAAKTYYEQNKMEYIKAAPKEAAKTSTPEFHPFEQVKEKVAVEVLKERRADEVSKVLRELSDELLAKAKASPSQLAAFAKSKGLVVKTSEKFNRFQRFVPGVGDVPALLTDAFSESSPLAKEPKVYDHRGGHVLVWNLKTFKPDTSNFAKEREKLTQQLTSRKSQGLYEEWMGELRKRAKVSVNKSLEAGA